MQLEVSKKSESSQLQEIESLKEALTRAEENNKAFAAQDEEKLRKEALLASNVSHTIWYSSIVKLKCAFLLFYQLACAQDEASLEREMHKTKIRELEAELEQQKNYKPPPVVLPCDHEDEINQLQVKSAYFLKSV